ncbi:hypothetical protein Sru01_24420 [Sphaerisporangium rufum]|uniref:ABC transporter permease n=1 Tax=Sphaerisporangium rufum TaxID=1381558 RepID=A0A919V4N7_9ACTN|nr:ABC transporter permease [Sphaerisporangium rufum]GII77460.1 hypothetical protein Sru01_24420 [Sphaerisporangium rufum]
MIAIDRRPGTSRASRQASIWCLTTVELRKTSDTRAGTALLAAIAVVAAGRLVAQLFIGEAADRDLTGFFHAAMLPVSLLLPVLGILLVTSEWSQRTAQTTFTLVPHRGRVVLAKAAAAVLLTVLAVAVSLALAALANAVAAPLVEADGSWALDMRTLAYGLLYQLVGVCVGLGVGMLLLNSAAALVVYYILPTVWSLVAGLVESLKAAARWLDLTVTTQPLLAGEMTAEAWRRLGTSFALWGLLPLVLGTIRLLRSEVK